MPATKLSMDWSGVTFTPTGGSAILITNVTDVQFDNKGTPKKFYGDASKYPKAVAVVDMVRNANVSTGDVAIVEGIAVGAIGTLVAVLNDLKNGAAAGAITYTLSNAVVVETSGKGKVNDYAMGDIKFEAYSADGSTDPLVFVVA